MKNLINKKVIITGATSGIGMAISKLLVKEGAYLYLIGRTFSALKKDLSSIKGFDSEKVKFIKCDFNDLKDVAVLGDKFSHEDHIDILIHCAGAISFGSLQDEKIENLDRQYRVNVRAPYLLTQKVLRRLKKAKGDIVFINSTTGLDSWEEVGQYSATKRALRAIADSLRKELKKDKVRISSLYLGSVDTPMQQKVQQMKGNEEYDPDLFIPSEVIADFLIYILKMPGQAMVTDVTIRQVN